MRESKMKALTKDFELSEGKKLKRGLEMRVVKNKNGKKVLEACNPYNRALRKIKREARNG